MLGFIWGIVLTESKAQKQVFEKNLSLWAQWQYMLGFPTGQDFLVLRDKRTDVSSLSYTHEFAS